MQAAATFGGKRRHSRTVLLAIIRIDGEKSTPIFLQPMGKIPGTLGDLLAIVEIMRSAPNPSGGLGPYATVPPLPPVSAFRFFDWALDGHAPETGVVEIPTPGVVFAVYGDASTEESYAMHALVAKSNLEQHPPVRQFLSSPESRFTPEKYSEIDVFVSYSSKDVELARELVLRLEKAKLSVFLAEKDIGLGTKWEPEIRRALKKCSVLVLLLTPDSKERPWVHFEAGAAWVLDTPIAIALSHVAPTDLPAVLPSYQCGPYVTNAQREAFTNDILALISKGK